MVEPPSPPSQGSTSEPSDYNNTSSAVPTLSLASLEISRATEILQSKFQETCRLRGETIPDPFRLIQRLSNLESSLNIIQSKVKELDKESEVVSSQVAEALLNNSLALDKLSLATGGYCQLESHSDDLKAVLLVGQQRKGFEKK